MRIKQLDINDEKLVFNQNENLILIKEDDIFGSPFLDAIKRVFCDTNVSLDCVCSEKQDIKCICEKYGTDFTIIVKVVRDRLPKNESISGTCGSFEVSCKSDLESTMISKRVLKRMFDLDFREMLMPMDTIRETAFYRGDLFSSDYTNYLLMHYRDYMNRSLRANRYSDVGEERAEGHVSKMDREWGANRTEWTAMEYFVNHFKKIDLGFCVIEFDKDHNELKIPDVEDDAQFDQIELCDYIIANQLNSLIEQSFGRDGATPLFIKEAFKNFGQKELDFFIKELRNMNRQVFIVESRDNAYLEKLCDKTIILEDKNND